MIKFLKFQKDQNIVRTSVLLLVLREANEGFWMEK